MKIEPYIFSKSGGFDWYHYLRICGGVGHGKDMGGKYNFVMAYLLPEQSAEIGLQSLDSFCRDAGIPWGGGSTIEEAYVDFQQALSLNPIL